LGRSFRFNETKGKTVDYVEFYTVHGYHCVDLAFADKTALQFTIDPCRPAPTPSRENLRAAARAGLNLFGNAGPPFPAHSATAGCSFTVG